MQHLAHKTLVDIIIDWTYERKTVAACTIRGLDQLQLAEMVVEINECNYFQEPIEKKHFQTFIVYALENKNLTN